MTFGFDIDIYVLAQIIWINILLSADNAIVVGMVAHHLPSNQKRTAIVIGTALAIVARVGAVFLLTSIMHYSGIRMISSALLAIVAVKLLCDEEKMHEKGAKVLRHGILHASFMILATDMVMSVDNILAIATIAPKDIVVLFIGLAPGIILIMTLGRVIAALMDRFSWLAYVGACFLAWAAGDLLVSDRLLSRWNGMPLMKIAEWAVPALFVMMTLGFALINHLRAIRAPAREMEQV